ncbi:MAG: GC-type dockerin domain-anchored protein [Phycisphaerales bacterium JB039]
MISRKTTALASAAALAILCGHAQANDTGAVDRIERAMTAFQDLQAAFPGAERYIEDGTISLVYGVPMTRGATAMDAATRWLQDWGGVFGAGALELTLRDEVSLKDGAMTALLYSQTIEGVPVDGGVARILVRHDDGQPTVVYGAGRLADRPADGALGAGDAPVIDVAAGEALETVQRMDSFDHLASWTEPELIWHYAPVGVERPVARLAWAFWGSSFGEDPQSYRFFVDVRTGALLEARWDLHNTDVTGRVRANAHTTLSPLGPIGPVNVPSNYVAVEGGATAVTGSDGSFTIPNPGTGFVNVVTGVEGPYCVINDMQGEEISASAGVTPPGPANLLLNQAVSEFTTAQVNALIGVGAAHNMFTARAPGLTIFDHQVVTNVNDGSGSCNAFFRPSDLSLNFYREGGGCPNSAYSTVVSHEYGHFIVNRLGLLQGSFGEGFSDAVSVVLWDTGIIAADFYGPGSPIRDLTRRPPSATFVCTDPDIYVCGWVLGSSWWEIRENLGAKHGDLIGLDITRELFVGWSLITLGGSGQDAAHPRTVVEALTIDDDDPYIGNGTPNFDEITAAFEVFFIPVPQLDRVAFSFPDGLPTLVNPDTETEFRVRVDPLRTTPKAGSATLFYSINGRTPVEEPMTQVGPNEYTATLPGTRAFDFIYYWVGALDTQDRLTTHPHDAPADGIIAQVGYAVVKDNFEIPSGWTVVNEDLTAGAWERGVPLGWGSSGEPMRDFDGSGRAWVTGNLVGDHDVDGGPTRLVSPNFDLEQFSRVQISYARWFTNDDRDIDRMTVEISNNGGITWVPVEIVAHQDDWTVVIANAPHMETIPTLTDKVRIRISVTDNPNNSVTEGGFDRFWIVSNVAVCRVDLDGDGETTFFDFLEFQNLFSAGDLKADFDGDGMLTFFDFLVFQNEFAVGCP